MLCFRAPLLVYLSGDHALLNLPVASVLLLFVYIKSSNKMGGIFCRYKEAYTRYILQQVCSVKGQIVQSWESGIQYKCKTIWDEQPIFSVLCLCCLLGWWTVRMKKQSSCPGSGTEERGSTSRRNLRGAEWVQNESRVQISCPIFKVVLRRGSPVWLSGLPAVALYPYPEFLVSHTFLQAFFFLPFGILCL